LGCMATAGDGSAGIVEAGSGLSRAICSVTIEVACRSAGVAARFDRAGAGAVEDGSPAK
jgi:hypothetical protein